MTILKQFDNKGHVKSALIIFFLISLVFISVFVFAGGDSVKDMVSEDKLSKIHKGLLDVKKDEKVRVLIQVKENSKEALKNKIVKGKVRQSFDDDLLFIETDGDEISSLVLDDVVVEVWPDLQTQSFLDTSVGQINVPYLWDLGFDGSFIIRDASDENVIYINAAGDLCLTGSLTQGGNP